MEINLISKQAVFDTLNSTKDGLTQEEASARLHKDGLNIIKTQKQRSFFQIFIEQFKNLLVAMLLVAALVSFAMGSFRDGSILCVVVFFNAFVGMYQDWKSENILNSLQNLVIDKCFVIRDGKTQEIPSSQLVVGDLVKLNEGDGIPADIRLIETSSFATNEFFLTGESVPAEKDANFSSQSKVLSEMQNCAFMGSSVARGEATGIVYATANNTEIGKIANQSSKIKTELSPLQIELDNVAKKITYFTIALTFILFAIELYLGQNLVAALTFAIGVAAAMVPEGLPAQITISLALGVQRLANKKAVVKKLSAVEALGAATVIATDKTGTITKNEMTIIHCHLDGQDYQVTGTGYKPNGNILGINGVPISQESLKSINLPLLCGYLASTGKVAPPDDFHADWYPIGDPTECAFSTLLLKAEYDLAKIDTEYSKIGLLAFDSNRKMATVIRKYQSESYCFTKGSIEQILKYSNTSLQDGKVLALTDSDKEDYLKVAEYHASQGKRIIALAYKKITEENYQIDYTLEQNLTFAGFVTMIDPPRENAAFAITKAYEAGVRVMMITGDNEITARAIAGQIGMCNYDGTLPQTINSQQLNALSDDELKKILGQRSVVFSRVSPEQKFALVSLLKQMGEVVAVTGDGVNDTLSLKKSDIGVAMGDKGSKVAQEAASMILLDDNFGTIVDAISEGRTIYNNLKKNVFANLIGNLAELTCILIGFVLAFKGVPMILLAIHILLIDLLANMLPLLMLTFDPPNALQMKSPPRKSGEMLQMKNLGDIAFNGILKGIISCIAFWICYKSHPTDPYRHEIAMTATMLSLIVCQFVNILSLRSTTFIINKYLISNINLFIGFGLTMLLVVSVIYIPFLNEYVHTAPLSFKDWQHILGGSIVYLLILEMKKFSSNKFQNK
ncbi:MAG: cation-transporting P-type ATPase [Cytophagales bacterium]